MKAVQIHDTSGSLQMTELAEPSPGEGDVLLRVEACGIGLTVVKATHEETGRRAVKLPRVPGHEFAGTIMAVGAGVNPARVGERALAYYYLSCGACAECTAGHESRCVNLRGNVGVATDGGYAELAVLPAWNALPFPDEIDSVSATVLSDAVGTPVHIARRAHIAPGERVAVVGAGGGVGIHMAQVARAFGAEVAGLDITQTKLDFLERELRIPAVDSSDFGAAALSQAWSGKADVVVDFLGTTESLSWGWSHLDRGGRLVCLATFEGDSIPVDPRNLVRSELALLGSRYTSRHEVGLAAKLVAAGAVQPVITRKVGLDGVASVHHELERGTLIGRGALVW